MMPLLKTGYPLGSKKSSRNLGFNAQPAQRHHVCGFGAAERYPLSQRNDPRLGSRRLSRIRKRPSFDLLEEMPRRLGDRSMPDDDRYLFLEAVNAAKDSLPVLSRP